MLFRATRRRPANPQRRPRCLRGGLIDGPAGRWRWSEWACRRGPWADAWGRRCVPGARRRGRPAARGRGASPDAVARDLGARRRRRPGGCRGVRGRAGRRRGRGVCRGRGGGLGPGVCGRRRGRGRWSGGACRRRRGGRPGAGGLYLGAAARLAGAFAAGGAPAPRRCCWFHGLAVASPAPPDQSPGARINKGRASADASRGSQARPIGRDRACPLPATSLASAPRRIRSCRRCAKRTASRSTTSTARDAGAIRHGEDAGGRGTERLHRPFNGRTTGWLHVPSCCAGSDRGALATQRKKARRWRARRRAVPDDPASPERLPDGTVARRAPASKSTAPGPYVNHTLSERLVQSADAPGPAVDVPRGGDAAAGPGRPPASPQTFSLLNLGGAPEDDHDAPA